MGDLELQTPPLQATDQDRLADLPGVFPAAHRAYGLLIVDDEWHVRGMLEAGLRQEGFAVWTAATGQEALELYRIHGEVIDVVLLDVRMPDLDGPQTLAALRDHSPQVRCCFMSGDLGGYTMEGLRSAGAVDVLQKPFPLREVARRLRDLACPPFARAAAVSPGR
jgi:DNA-binding response OmpR family regulator